MGLDLDLIILHRVKDPDPGNFFKIQFLKKKMLRSGAISLQNLFLQFIVSCFFLKIVSGPGFSCESDPDKVNFNPDPQPFEANWEKGSSLSLFGNRALSSSELFSGSEFFTRIKFFLFSWGSDPDPVIIAGKLKRNDKVYCID